MYDFNTPTVHILRRRKKRKPKGCALKRYTVWRELELLHTTDSLSAARAFARKTPATELVECWETGKAFERSKRGAWKEVKNTG